MMRRGWLLVTTMAIGGLAAAAPAAGAAAPAGFSAKAASQVASLQKLKTSLTPTERKLDSRLAVELRRRANPAMTAGMPKLDTGVEVTKSGATDVDLAVTEVSDGLLARLQSVGANVRAVSKRLDSIRAQVPLSALEQVAAWKDVVRVQVAMGAITAGLTPQRAPESKEAKAARIDAQLRAALAPVAAAQGAVVSEGDRTHAADTVRDRRHVTGVGVKVCALSDGVNSLAAEQAAGELPAVDVLPGQEGSGDEGTAMLEIVHDLVPGAELGFATAFNSLESFADNIRGLRFQAHCDIIVDDVIYYAEDPFQDGPIAQSVSAVIADGGLYFSSAGNEGNTLDGTSGNYEGDFVDSGRGVGKFAGAAHDFDPGAGVQVYEPLTDASDGPPILLFWADPLGHAADDYDLYMFDAQGNVLAFSQDVQDGDDDPFESFAAPSGSGRRIAVVKYSGATRYFQLTAFRGRFANSADGLIARVSPGVTRGHSAVVGAFSTAAAPAFEPLPFDLEPGDPPNPAGPFPGVFTRTQKPERFTSDGPRRVFFHPDGTPITPGNFTSTGGEVRHKPDITAADGVSTGVPDFAPFFGTSAAAPHAAAIAALVLSGNPGETTDEVRTAFDATALDLAPAGVDNRTGHGILRADRVLTFTGATAQPLVRAGQPTVTPTTGDGDAFLEPGETGTLTLPVTNVGDGTATGINVTVDSSDPQATITPHARSYGNLARGASRSRDFTISLAADHPLGKPVELAVRVTFAGALSPTRSTLRVPTGEPGGPTTTFAYSGPPVDIPDASAVGASVTIPVSGIGYASNLTFSIDGTECTDAEGATTVGIDHTFVSDLVGMLTAPGGQLAVLFSQAGGAGNNLCQVVFDDAAATPFSSVTSDDAPFTGTWRPDEPLGGLLADPVDGTWTFQVVDTAAADVGSIRAVSLHVRGFVR